MKILDSLKIFKDNQNVNMDSYWLPFTPNRQFKKNPKIIEKANGMYYFTSSGEKVLDGIAGLWCVNAGHCRDEIVKAIKDEAENLDYATAFNIGHPSIFKTANKITSLAPNELNKVFFTNSGSEAVDTALKISIGYHRAIGDASRHRLIGRERGYHGVGFGGISVGGILTNRKVFSSNLLPGVDHIVHTHLPQNRFSKGIPENGDYLADDFERVIQLHDPSTISAIIIEPVAGSTGVLVPPKNYLRRIRELCDKYSIILIFDEVITGFGRTGKAFASQTFDVTPDILVFAKGVSNGSVPLGGVLVHEKIYKAYMNGPEWATEFYHGYTYSGHPLAMAASSATLDLYAKEDLFERANLISNYFQDSIHKLKDHPYVVDIRNIGLMGAIELEPRPGKKGTRAYDCFSDCFEKNVLVRNAGDVIALTPPLITEKKHIDQIVDTLSSVLKKLN